MVQGREQNSHGVSTDKQPNPARRRMSYKRPLLIAAGQVGACALLWLCWGLYLYWNDVKLVNFLAAWIPFVLSVVLAFVPEHKMTSGKKLVWRSSVVTVGLVWSLVLWHQQVVTDMAARDDQRRIVTDAVNLSNKHSDEKISSVRSDLQSVRSDIRGVDKDLQDTKGSITSSLSKAETNITSGLGKVGKPEPPELARLQFSIFEASPTANFPRLTSIESLDTNGNVAVDVYFTNVSSTAAEGVDVWIAVCDQCSFVAEPTGYDRPQGLDGRVRHKLIPLLNPGTSFEKTRIDVKPPTPIPPWIAIAFKYSCKACGKMPDPQQLKVFLQPLPKWGSGNHGAL
jgi:hypothetical protein